jgi:hypothetical protein
LPFQLPRGVIEERTHAILGVLQILPSISDIFLLGTVAVAVCFKVGFAQLVVVFFEVLTKVVLLTFGGLDLIDLRQRRVSDLLCMSTLDP